MDFKINGQIKGLAGFSGPSQSYYNTTERFQDILSDKLGAGVRLSIKGENPVATNASAYADYQLDATNFIRSASMDTAIANLRNSNFSDAVINTMNVTEKSTLTAQEMDQRLAGTNLAGLGSSFKNAEAKYGVNAMFLLGLAIHESDYGKSRIAQDKKNLFGYQAYDSSPYASAKSFSSFAEGIDTVASYLSQNYLKPSGKHFNGYSIADIGKKYATSPTWAQGIEKRINSFLGV